MNTAWSHLQVDSKNNTLVETEQTSGGQGLRREGGGGDAGQRVETLSHEMNKFWGLMVTIGKDIVL